MEAPCADGAPRGEGAPAGDGFPYPEESAPASKAVRKRILRDCVGSHKTVCSLNKSIAVVGKHFAEATMDGGMHSIGSRRQKRKRDRVEGRGRIYGGAGGVRVDDELLWDDLANIQSGRCWISASPDRSFQGRSWPVWIERWMWQSQCVLPCEISASVTCTLIAFQHRYSLRLYYGYFFDALHHVVPLLYHTLDKRAGVDRGRTNVRGSPTRGDTAVGIGSWVVFERPNGVDFLVHAPAFLVTTEAIKVSLV